MADRVPYDRIELPTNQDDGGDDDDGGALIETLEQRVRRLLASEEEQFGGIPLPATNQAVAALMAAIKVTGSQQRRRKFVRPQRSMDELEEMLYLRLVRKPD